jgi:hypothetical protein
MLMVAPRGSTKLEVLLETPALSSMHLIVRGSVAEEDAVEKAVINAGLWARARARAFLRGRSRNIMGRVIVA